MARSGRPSRSPLLLHRAHLKDPPTTPTMHISNSLPHLLSLNETLNRTVKLALDSGQAATLEEALNIFKGYRLKVEVGFSAATSPTQQAALLTVVNTASRCFLGGVEVAGCPDATLLVPWRHCRTLHEAVHDVGGECLPWSDLPLPTISIGTPQRQSGHYGDFAVRATFHGWSGGVVPWDEEPLPEEHEFTPAGVLAGALAVAEAFQFVRGSNAMAGRRSMGLSLWRPEPSVSWRDEEAVGPRLEWLPSRLWLIGLGHLGQAYLWTMGFLPYANPREVLLVLQDTDKVAPSNISTSVLTNELLIGQRKTRVVAQWCEERGFESVICERVFRDDFLVATDEPRVALCGVDNPVARAYLEDVGFEEIVEAGLGRGEDYLNFQVHRFPACKTARSLWGGRSQISPVEGLAAQPAYRALEGDGLDRCGVITLTNRAVGASFVGVAVSTLVVAELLRLCAGRHQYAVIDGNLRNMTHNQALLNQAGETRNLGRTRATSQLQ